MASGTSTNIVVAFTQNQDLYHIIEHCGKLGKTELKFSIYNPRDCETATKDAQVVIDQLSIMRPKIDVQLAQKKEVLQDAEIIAIPGLYLSSKSDDQFAAIADNVMRETFGMLQLKDECKIFISGSFRGLVAAKALADAIDEKHWKNIEVVDPYVFSGVRLFECEDKEDPIIYPHKEAIFTVINADHVAEKDKEKVKLLKRKENGKIRKMDAIECEALSQALQFYLEQSTRSALVGRFPTDDEKAYFNIGDFPVILPPDMSSPIKEIIKDQVKKLAEQVSQAFPDEDDSDEEG